MRRLLAALLLLLAVLGAPTPAFAAPVPAPAPGVDFEQTALDLEQIARLRPGTPAASEALAEAALLRLGLGQLDQADADALLLDRTHGGLRFDLVVRVTLARARRHAGLGAWDALRELLGRAMPRPGRAAIDDRLEAHALLGRALGNLGRRKEAELEYRRVLALAPREGIAARGAEAIGEARFFFAEMEQAQADRVVLAPYRGKPTRDAILAYLLHTAARWMERRRYVLLLAERAYLRVLGVEVAAPQPPPPPPPPAGSGLIGLLNSGADPNAPTAPWGRDEVDPLDPERALSVPSPRWAIAALTRIAMGWGTFVKQVRTLPIAPRSRVPPAGWPAEIPWSEPVHGLSYEDGFSEEQKQRSKRACQAVLRLALRHHIADENTRTCEAWLAHNHGAEYHVLDELPPKIAPPQAAGPFAPAPRAPP